MEGVTHEHCRDEELAQHAGVRGRVERCRLESDDAGDRRRCCRRLRGQCLSARERGRLMTNRAKELFPQFPTHYLKTVGELLLCGIALQATIDAGAPCSDSWYQRARALVDESVRIG